MKSLIRKPRARPDKRTDVPPQTDLRHRILSAASDLLAVGGAEAITTRAVAEAAGVQPPAIYRFFDDKTALLDALTEFAFEACVASKPPIASQGDPVEAIRRGWDDYVEFGLSHPALFLLMYTGIQSSSGAVRMAHAGVQQQISDVAATGRLRLDETRAAQLLHAAASGLVLTLLGMPETERDMSVSGIARDAALASIILDFPVSGVPTIGAVAVTLRALLDQADTLSTMERGMLSEWLDRIAHSDRPV
jgi:AcrR family transcriptional regulator